MEQFVASFAQPPRELVLDFDATGARFTAVMYSLAGILSPNGIEVLRWMEARVEASAKNAGRPPDELSPWLPWAMSEERMRAYMAAG